MLSFKLFALKTTLVEYTLVIADISILVIADVIDCYLTNFVHF